MNPKIFVIAAIAVLVGILGVIFVTTSNSDTFEDGSAQEIQNVEAITVDLEEVSILQISERAAILEIQIKLNNPNSRSVIAQLLQYSLFASSETGEVKIATGQRGSRPSGRG